MSFWGGSDLAFEAYRCMETPPRGVDCSAENLLGFRVDRLRIMTEEAALVLHKPLGRYVTVDCGGFHLMGERARRLLVSLLAGELRGMTDRLCGRLPDAELGVFVAGLGNAELTTDALGPKTVRRLTATRHLREHEKRLYRDMGCASLSALAPGVLGQTGIETVELLKGVVEHVSPDLIVVIDALAAKSCDRLASTVQLTDVGIVPGSGVGNHRSAITEQTMGVPVITLGAPTVVPSATLVRDALSAAGIDETCPALTRVLESGKSFFVAPKECDEITEAISCVFSDAIAAAFTAGF